MQGNSDVFPQIESDNGTCYTSPDGRGLDLRTWLFGQILPVVISRSMNMPSREDAMWAARTANLYVDVALAELQNRGR